VENRDLAVAERNFRSWSKREKKRIRALKAGTLKKDLTAVWDALSCINLGKSFI
jgi:hypothetical protein